MKVTGPLKVHGGKGPLATKIVALLPSHRTYCEPFAGGLSVLLAKDPEGVSEVANDINGELTNFWRVLQGDNTFPEFKRILDAVPFSEVEYRGATEAGELIEDYPVESAVNFFIRCRQSLAGRMKSFAAISTSRTRRGMNEQVSAWLTAIEGLPAVHERLRRVLILNRDALKVIRDFDKPETVFYCDSPYHPSTRTAPEVYQFEMTDEQHREYLDTLNGLKHAKAVVSGYRCELYDRELARWKRVDFEVANHASGAKTKRKMVESVWLSP